MTDLVKLLKEVQKMKIKVCSQLTELNELEIKLRAMIREEKDEVFGE